MRKITTRTSKHTPISERIDKFVDKLKKIDGSCASKCRNERRWLGAEGESERGFALRTIKNYMSMYRKRIASDLPHHKRLEGALVRLEKKHGGIISELINLKRRPIDNIYAVKRYLSEMEDKTTGLYDDLKKLKIPHEAYFLMNLKAGQLATVKDDDKKTVKIKLDKKYRISIHAVENAVRIGLERDDSGRLKSNHRALLALMLCTGRRPIEICKLGNFASTKKGVEGLCQFSGQAKKKYGEKPGTYDIPVLFVKPHQVIDTINDLRSKLGDVNKLTETQINVRMSGESSNEARELLKNDQIVLYTARAIYATICYERSHTELDRDSYISSILGHGERDDVSNRSYKSVIITDEPFADVESAFREQRSERERVDALGKRKNKGYSKKTNDESNHIKTTEKQINFLQKKQNEADKMGKAVSSLNQWAISYVTQNKFTKFTQTMIAKLRPTSRPAIKKWLELVDGK